MNAKQVLLTLILAIIAVGMLILMAGWMGCTRPLPTGMHLDLGEMVSCSDPGQVYFGSCGSMSTDKHELCVLCEKQRNCLAYRTAFCVGALACDDPHCVGGHR